MKTLLAIIAVVSCSTPFVLAQATQPAAHHPGVVADEALLTALRTGPQRAARRDLLASVATILTDQARQDPKLRQPNPDALDPWLARITVISLNAAVSGEPAAIDEAKAWLAEGLSLSPDGRNNYEYGAYAQGLGTAYDLLWPHLEGSQRTAAREHLAVVCRNLYLACKGEKPGWWHGLYLHHDLWIPTAGLGVGCAALLSEVAEARGWYDFARGEFDKVFSFLGADGGWTEGPAPWCYGVGSMIAFFDAVERLEGKGYADRPWLANTAKYRLYTLLAPRLPLRYALVDDSHEDGRYGNRGSAAAPLLFWLAGRYGDSHAQWLASLEEQVDRKEFAARKSGLAPLETIVYTAGFGALWFDPAVAAAQPPQKVSSVLFDNTGLACFRSGWSDKDEVLTFQCGPLGGHIAADYMAGHPEDILAGSISHVHANANSFTYYAAGQPWIIGPGYGFRDTGFQNTVMLEAGSQTWAMQPGPRLLRQELADDHAYLLGDATKAFPASAKIDRAWRHVLWLPGTGLFLCDQLTTMDGDARYIRRYDWQFHHPAGLPLTRNDSSYRLSARQPGGPSLLVDLFTNGKPRYTTSTMTMPNGYTRLARAGLELPGEVPPRCWIAAAIHLDRPADQAAPATAPGSGPNARAQAAASASGPGWTAVVLPGTHQASAVIFALEPQQVSKMFASEAGLVLPTPDQADRVDLWLVGLAPGETIRLAASVAAGQTILRSPDSQASNMRASEAGVIHLVARPTAR